MFALKKKEEASSSSLRIYRISRVMLFTKNFPLLGVFLFLAVFLVLPSTGHAGTNQWTSNGPSGQMVKALAVSPNFASDKTLFAGTNGGGVFKSSDGGATWSAANTGLTNTYSPTLAVSPNYVSDQTVFAGTSSGCGPTPTDPCFGGGVYKSTDGGASWIQINSGLINTDVHSLAVSPNFASDMTIFGSTGDGVYSYTFSGDANFRNYFFNWYDSKSMNDWILMANPADSRVNLNFGLTIGAKPESPGNGFGLGDGIVPPGQTITPLYGGQLGGPVKVTSRTGDKAIVSRRSLLSSGSFEEVPGTDESRLSDHYYWTWYDQASSGFANWILIANPADATDTVHAVISFVNGADGSPVSAESDIKPGENWNPTFPGKMGGPVEVKAYKSGGSWPTDARNVFASQRVLSNNGTAFNDLPGIPEKELSDTYLWTWYDDVGGANWVLIANPSATKTARIRIYIGNDSNPQHDPANPANDYFDIAPGGEVTPRFGIGPTGPVRVVAVDASDDVTPTPVIASQRSLWGPSLEEVPGTPASSLSSDYNWTWYDNIGGANWILISNPLDWPTSRCGSGGSGCPNVEWVDIYIHGIKMHDPTNPDPATNDHFVVAPGQSIFPQFDAQQTPAAGPVEVRAYKPGGDWNNSSDRLSVVASQRVLWNGYFNEVLGTVLN